MATKALKATTAPVKASNGNGKAQANEPTWHGQYDARIAKANGALGTVPTADAYRAALTLGPAKGKRPGVEALWVAMTLRPEGASIAQYTAAGECRTANNWLQYLNDEGNRHVYKQVHVSVVGSAVGSVRYTRLTAKGVAHCMTQGMAKGSLERLAKPFTPPKGAAPVKPAKGRAAPQAPVAAAPKPAKPRKPAGAPIQAPAPQAPQAPAAAPQAPRTVLTETGPKPLQPQPQPAPVDSK